MLRWGEFIENSRFVRIELVHHYPDAVRIRVENIRQFDHPVDPFCRPSSLRNFDSYPATQQFGGDVESLFPVAFVTVIDTSDRSRPNRERMALMPTKSLTGLVKTDDWTSFVVWFVVQSQNIFHVVDKGSVLFRRDFPVDRKTRFQDVF